jgi:DNA (cytosine-5)-methyltransferase 1
VDFFCGCGGASEGLRQANFDISLGIDFDENAAATYQVNFPEAAFINRDIREIETREVLDLLAGNDDTPLLFTACAPCQPFSSQNKFKANDDNRVSLLDETHRFIIALQPEYIMLENVPGMQRIDENVEGPFCRFIEFLNEQGYQHITFVAKSQEYGVPQKRKRLVLLASSLAPMVEPPKTHGDGLRPFPTVRDFIDGYPQLTSGDVCEFDHVHATARMNDLNIARIQHTPEGGDRRNWPAHLVNECHKNYTGHTDTYGRMSWDSLAPTLTTKCNSYSNGRFGHPDINQDRAISVREASRLQTFPVDYQFVGSIGYMARQVGNAVPCELARQFGLSIYEHHYTVQEGQTHGEDQN